MNDRIKLFMSEYQRHIKINKDEKRFLYYLIKYRYIMAAYIWTSKLLKGSSAKNRNKVMEAIKINVDRYWQFNKIPLNEFLSWIR